jgi:peptidoglycan hydrolase-like protein with peptidoglycan-binding domain
MQFRVTFAAGAALLVMAPAFAGNAVSDMHPEEAYPDDAPLLVSPGPYVDLVTQVQKKLHELDFDPGPVNGAASSKLQAALAQFQLSRALPVSGMFDEQTLKELGVASPVEGMQNARAGEEPGPSAGIEASSAGATAD